MSSKKYRGARKGSRESAAYIARLEVAKKIEQESMRAYGRRYMLDMVTVALGRMGYGEVRLARILAAVKEVCDEYILDATAEADESETIWYTVGGLERELKKCMGSSYVPYEVRYKFDVQVPKVPAVSNAMELKILPIPELAAFLKCWHTTKSLEELEAWLREEAPGSETS